MTSFVPNDLVWLFQKLLIHRDFHPEPSFMLRVRKNRRQLAGWNCLAKVKGEPSYCIVSEIRFAAAASGVMRLGFFYWTRWNQQSINKCHSIPEYLYWSSRSLYDCSAPISWRLLPAGFMLHSITKNVGKVLVFYFWVILITLASRLFISMFISKVFL